MFTGSPDRRNELAVRLVGEGMTIAQLRTIAEAKEQPALIVHTCKTQAGWREFLEEYERHTAARAARGTKDSRGRKVREPTNQPAEGYAEQQARLLKDYAVERVLWDGKSVADVAFQCDRTPELVQLWVDDAECTGWEPEWAKAQRAESREHPGTPAGSTREPPTMSPKRAEFYRMVDRIGHPRAALRILTDQVAT